MARSTSISGPVRRPAKKRTGCRLIPARKFDLMARFYVPKKEFFDKVWKLSDVEKEVGGTVGGR
jgi:hypothetical protein